MVCFLGEKEEDPINRVMHHDETIGDHWIKKMRFNPFVQSQALTPMFFLTPIFFPPLFDLSQCELNFKQYTCC